MSGFAGWASDSLEMMRRNLLHIRRTPELLTFTKDLLITKDVSMEDYPSTWDGLQLTYQFEPGQHADGVTVHIPLPLLNQISPEGFEWQVPGLREDLVIALIRSLPKAIRG